MSASQLNLPLPSKLNLTASNLAVVWRKFYAQWSNYEVATDLETANPKKRIAVFLACAGADAQDLFATFDLSDGDRENFETVVGKFREHCVGIANVTYERYVFNKRSQDDTESFDTFVADLRRLVKSCDYGELEDSIIKDRIVMGIRDDTTRKKLLQTRTLNLHNACDICRAAESASRQLKELHGADKVESLNIDRNQRPARSQSRNRYIRRDTSTTRRDSSTSRDDHHKSQSDRKCRFCVLRHRFGKNECPAFGKTCNSCGLKNHYAASIVCRNKNDRKLRRVRQLDTDDDYDELLALDGPRYKRLTATLLVNGVSTNFTLDTGSSVNVLPMTLAQKIGMHRYMNPSDTTLRMFSDQILDVEGTVECQVQDPKSSEMHLVRFYVAKTHKQAVLGLQTCLNFGLIQVQIEHLRNLQADACQPMTKEIILRQYSDLFTGYGKFEGTVHLDTDPAVASVRVTPRRIPLHIRDKVEREIKALCDNDILEPTDEYMPWSSHLQPVLKSNGEVRICMDPNFLNDALKSVECVLPVLDDVLPELSNAKVYSVLDTRHAFFHCVLDEPTKRLMCMETVWGKFLWKRLPQGIKVASQVYALKMREALMSLKSVRAIADDIIVWGCGETLDEAQKDHDHNLTALLNRCRQCGIRLNKSKMRINCDSVDFMGFRLTSNGLMITDSKVKAITEMPTPTDKQSVQRLLGAATFVARFLPNFSDTTKCLRELTHKNVEFVWDDTVHGVAFRKVKQMLTSAEVLQYYDPAKQIKFEVDSSINGCGAVLLQNDKPVAYASRSFTATESRLLSTIEREATAALFACEKFNVWTFGNPYVIQIITDHKPLISISKKPLHNAPLRLQRIFLRLSRYNVRFTFKPGRLMHVSDCLSRASLPHTNDLNAYDETLASLDEQTQKQLELVASPELRRLLDISAKQDSVHQDLIKMIHTGWPEKPQHVPKDLRPYHTYADELTVSNGHVYKGDRIVIPVPARDEVMKRLHSSHIGLGGLLRRARKTVYFPGITTEITRVANACQICQKHQNDNQKEPLMSHDVPPRVWDKCGVDIFTWNRRDYLVTTCYLSNFFEVDRLKTKSCKEIIRILKGHFSRWGTPSFLCSDNSPFNSAEFTKFAKDWDFQQIFSSPTYPQSNGKVEKSVQTIKKIMQKAVDDNLDVYKALLEFRNTPSESSNLSPVEIMLNRQTRSVLPVANSKLNNAYQGKARQALIQSKYKQAFYYNRTARQRQQFSTGDNVRIKDRPTDKHWRRGVITNCLPHRSYQVQLSDNSSRRRTSRHIRWSPTPPIILDEYDVNSHSESANGSNSTSPKSSAPDTAVDRTVHRPSPSLSSNEAAETITSTDRKSNSQTVSPDGAVNNESLPRSILKKRSYVSSVAPTNSNNTVIYTRSGRTVRRPQRYTE